MARENQLLVDDERSEYFCSPCRRSFSSARGAMQHAATAAIHRDEWCYDCDWLFVNPDALENHLSHSSQHGNNHHHREREENNRTHNRRRRSSDHECTVCGEVYSHPDDLAEHEETHSELYEQSEEESEEKTYSYLQCRVCDREFDGQSDILQHLEGSTCESGIDSDYIRELALRYDYRGCITNRCDRQYPFRCPECDDNFRFISGLVQHIEGRACRQELNGTIWDVLECIQDQLGWSW